MERRNSKGEVTKIPRLSTESTRSSQSSVSSIYDVFASEATTEGRSDLLVSGMKIRSEKNLHDEEGQNDEARAANVTPTDPFEEREQMLIRPDRHDYEDPEGSGDDFERERVEESQKTSECPEAHAGEELFFKGTSRSETGNSSRGKEQSSLAKQSKNAMMSTISPREEKSSSRAKKCFKKLYDERMMSLRTDGLSSGLDHPGIMHSDTDFTPSPRQEKNKKAMSGITMGASSTIDRLMMSWERRMEVCHRALGCNLN